MVALRLESEALVRTLPEHPRLNPRMECLCLVATRLSVRMMLECQSPLQSTTDIMGTWMHQLKRIGLDFCLCSLINIRKSNVLLGKASGVSRSNSKLSITATYLTEGHPPTHGEQILRSKTNGSQKAGESSMKNWIDGLKATNYVDERSEDPYWEIHMQRHFPCSRIRASNELSICFKNPRIS